MPAVASTSARCTTSTRRKRHGAADRFDVAPDLPGAESVIGADDVDIVLVLTSMNEHGRADADGARGGQARARREAARDVVRGGAAHSSSSPGASDGSPRLRAAHPPQPDIPGDARVCPRGADRRPPLGAGALRLGRAVVGRVVLPAGRRVAVRSRRLQRDDAVRALRPRSNGSPRWSGRRSRSETSTAG